MRCPKKTSKHTKKGLFVLKSLLPPSLYITTVRDLVRCITEHETVRKPTVGYRGVRRTYELAEWMHRNWRSPVFRLQLIVVIISELYYRMLGQCTSPTTAASRLAARKAIFHIHGQFKVHVLNGILFFFRQHDEQVTTSEDLVSYCFSHIFKALINICNCNARPSVKPRLRFPPVAHFISIF